MVAKDYKKVFTEPLDMVSRNQASMDRANRGVKGVEAVTWSKSRPGELRIDTGVLPDTVYTMKKQTMKEHPRLDAYKPGRKVYKPVDPVNRRLRRQVNRGEI